MTSVNLPSLTDLENQTSDVDDGNPRTKTFNQPASGNGCASPTMSDPGREARLQEITGSQQQLSTPRWIEVKVLEMQAAMNQLQLQLLAMGGDANNVSSNGGDKYRYGQQGSIGPSDADSSPAPGAVSKTLLAQPGPSMRAGVL